MSTPWRDPDEGRRRSIENALMRDPALLANGATTTEATPEPESTEGLPPFPAIAWRGIFAEYNLAMRGTTEASDVAHFATLWACIGSALGRSVYWFSGDVVYPNTYLCIFGTSGDKKTTAMRRTFSASLLSGAPQVEIISNVGTPEGLAEHFQKTNGEADRNICLFFWEEFASLLTRGRWSGATILEFLTETFDSPANWGLKYKKNPVSITEPTPTILTGTTTDWFWKSARPEDFYGGCLNRFLFLTGPKKAPIPDPAPIDSRVDRVRQVITDLRGLAESGGIEARWAGNAKQLWREYYTGHERIERDGLLGAACKRIHVYVRKLALAYAACERTLPEVTAEQLKAAIAVGMYAERCTEILIDERGQSSRPEGELERRFMTWLEKHEGERVRRMQQKMHRYCGSAEIFNRVLKSLLLSDQIEIRENGKDGRRVFLSL